MLQRYFITIECSVKVTALHCFHLRALIQDARVNKFTNFHPTMASNENEIRTIEPEIVIQEHHN